MGGEVLLPCPSGHTKTTRDNNNIYGSWWVKCHDGECSWRAAGKTEAEAIAGWNTRSELDRKARIEKAVGGDGVYRLVISEDGHPTDIYEGPLIFIIRSALSFGLPVSIPPAELDRQNALLAEMGEALAGVANVLAAFDAESDKCPFRKPRTPPSEKPCPKCRAGADEGCRYERSAAFNLIIELRTALARYQEQKR